MENNVDNNTSIKSEIENLINMGDVSNAKVLIKEYLRSNKIDINILSMQAVIAIMEQDLTMAEKIIKEGLKINPSNGDLTFNLAYVYETKQNWSRAYQLYSDALVYLGNESHGEIYESLSRLDEYDKSNKKDREFDFYVAMIENNNLSINEFKHLDNKDISTIVIRLLRKSEDNLSLIISFLSSISLRDNNFQENRIFLSITQTVLEYYGKENENILSEKVILLFEKYIKYGGYYLKYKYRNEKISYIYKFEDTPKEKFLMLMYLYLIKKNSGETEYALEYLKEAWDIYPHLNQFLLYCSQNLKVEVQYNDTLVQFNKINSGESKLNILQGSIEIANQINTLVDAQNQIDSVNSLGLNYYPSYLDYGNTCLLDINKTVHKHKQKLSTDIAQQAMSTFDVFHFHYGTSMMLDLTDLPLLKEQGKKVYMHHWGTDVRRLSIAKQISPYAKSKDENEELIIRRLEHLGKYIDNCIVADAELYKYVEGYYKNIHLVRQALNLDNYLAIPNFQFRKEKPVIVHAPTSSDYKGTNIIERAIERLKSEFNFEYRLVQNMPHDKAKKIYRDADIIIDQLHSNGHGLLSLEAMALGKPVICSVSEFMMDFYPKDLPIVSATPENIEGKIRLLLKDTEIRKDLGERGVKYVQKYHDHNAIGRELVGIYTL